jgi:8-oxo-dGTP pyrophosphatase MutT (NUDIX family)
VTSFEILARDDPRLHRRGDLEVAVHAIRSAHLAGDDAEAHRAEILEFIAEHPDAAWRTCEPGHLTGSALVVDASGERTLLLLHRKLGRWFQPGGHADGDANLAAVALREAEEETGVAGLRVVVPAIDVDVHRVEPPGEAAHLHLDVRYLVLAPEGATEHGNEESLALCWLREDELDELDPPVDLGTRRLVARGLAIAASLRDAELAGEAGEPRGLA